MTDPVTLLLGDCLEVMPTLDAESVDAVVTDPPYGLEFMGKKWDKFWSPPGRQKEGGIIGTDGVARTKTRPVSANMDAPKYVAGAPFQAWCEQWGREVLRVTKPGGYLLAFGGTRTHHRLVCALEDAGWIIRDELDWIYASGFPKGKANLKPAHEPIVLARKPGPLRPLGIDECRIGYTSVADSADVAGKVSKNPTGKAGLFGVPGVATFNEGGRWPSNVLLSDPALFDEPNPFIVGSGAVTEPAWGKTSRGGNAVPVGEKADQTVGGFAMRQTGEETDWYKDSGGYSRFFIIPKADRAERNRGLTERSSHPTVKPIDLMRHLVRLVTPPGGVVLDPFLGSGTTALAASEEGFSCIGIEREAEYLEIARGRLAATKIGMGL